MKVRTLIGFMVLSFLLSGCAQLLSWQQEKNVHKARIAELENKCREYRTQYYRLIEQMKKQEAQSRARINELQKEINSLKQESEKREQELLSKTDELAFSLKQKEKELQLKEEKYNVSLASLNKRIDELTKQIESLKTDKTNLEQALAREKQVSQQKDAQLKLIQQENQKLNALIDDQKKQISKNLSDIMALNQNLQSLKDENRQLKRTNEELARQVEMLKKEKALAQTPVPLPEWATISPEIKTIYPELKGSLARYIKKDEVTISMEKRGLVLTIQNEALFEPGTVILSNSGKEILTKLIGQIQPIKVKEITVVGHTDNQPLQDLPFFDNWALGSARASNVVRYMVKQGIDPKILKPVSASFYHPVASNSTPEGRRKNRRVEIIIR